MRAVLTTLVVVLLLAAAGWVVFLYSGLYDVAATQPHWDVTAWSFETLLHNSVEARAERITPPGDLADRSRIETGFAHYRETCELCHGGPGVETTEIALGMYPAPPKLVEEAGEESAEELFWITKHGIKMTGMPAFGPTHPDEDLWSIVAFVRTLPDLSPEEYARLAETVPRHHHPAGGHGEGGQHGEVTGEASPEGHNSVPTEAHEHAPGEEHRRAEEPARP